MKVKITLRSENLKEVMDALNGKEDYGTITKVIEIDQSKKNIEYLVKSGKILDWDFEGTEEKPFRQPEVPRIISPIKGGLRPVPTEHVVLGPGPHNPPRREEDGVQTILPNFGREIKPVARPVRKKEKPWNVTKSEIAGTLMQLYPDGITPEDVYCLLGAICQCPVDEDIEWSPETLLDMVVPKLAGIEISESDPVTVAILDYLDIMYGHQSPAEKAESFVESVGKSWSKRGTIREGLRSYFEYTFATKLAGI